MSLGGIDKKYSDRELIDLLKKAEDETEYSFSFSCAIQLSEELDWFPHPNIFRFRFGGWNSALRRAGIDFVERSYSEDEILEDLYDLSCRIGRIPKISEVDEEENLPHPSTLIDRFGSWSDMIDEMKKYIKSKDIEVIRDELVLGEQPRISESFLDCANKSLNRNEGVVGS